MAAPVRLVEGGIELRLRLQPKASREGFGGVATEGPGAGRLRARVRAAAREGAANAALIALVAKALAVPKSRVTLTAGAKDRNKTLFIAGDGAELQARTAALLGDSP